MKEKVIDILNNIINDIKNDNYDNIISNLNCCYLDYMAMKEDNSVCYYDFSNYFDNINGLGDAIYELKRQKSYKNAEENVKILKNKK